MSQRPDTAPEKDRKDCNRQDAAADCTGIPGPDRMLASPGPGFGRAPLAEGGTDKAVFMRCDLSLDLFAPNQPISPYLVDWRQAFADLDPAASAPAALVFDRGPYPPVIERLRLPLSPDAQGKRLIELYLSALVNNVVCTAGAKRATLAAAPGLDPGILAAVRSNLLLHPDSFSDMSLYFLHRLIESVFGEGLVIDAAAGLLLEQVPGSGRAAGSDAAAPLRPGLALAINIGQHLTSWGLVRLTADGGCQVMDLTRRKTCPGEAHCCLTEAIGGIVAAARRSLGPAAAAVEAVGIAVAATVLDGMVRPVAEFGLFAACPNAALGGAAEAIRQVVAQAFPGRPGVVINDARAQALFAYHHGGGRQAVGGGHLLTVRLGACPCVHVLDANGHSAPGFDEYGWLVTRACPSRPGATLFSTPRMPLSHYGVAMAAHELGLLTRYGLGIEEAIPFFHGRLTGPDARAAREAAGVYAILGAHLAMLAAEIHRTRPIGAVLVPGSRANRLDVAAFAAMRAGFEAFALGRPLVPQGIELLLIEDASAEAGLVGAARAALSPD
ncbi:hypothetical protein [Desulfovibrio sp. DV]|uniref:hypothetical protein n=1 Tax=Desulfovibrio sp. DV TaxID=1844708 RepID=UPI000B2DB80C|nr:hypothetical protein [Desulfovibrio sp. DV]